MNEKVVCDGLQRKQKIGWRLANHGGFLHAINRRGVLWMIKKLLSRDGSPRLPVKVTSIPGCNFYNRERLRLSCKRISVKGSRTLFVSLLKTKPFSNDAPEVVYEFFLEEGEFCEITESEDGFEQVLVNNLADMYIDEPDCKVLPRERFYKLMVPKWVRSQYRHEPQPAVTLFNDGEHLYAVCEEGKKLLSFRLYRKETSSYICTWMKFLEKEVLFKTFGHTLDKSVIVSFREKQNSWSVALTIKKEQAVTIDELVSYVGVLFHN